MQRLGQHFLKKRPVIAKIISALELHENDFVIEIGPGTGALTIPLAKKCLEINCKLVAIEKDPELAISVERLGFSKVLKVITGDALKLLAKI